MKIEIVTAGVPPSRCLHVMLDDTYDLLAKLVEEDDPVQFFRTLAETAERLQAKMLVDDAAVI